jgi:hypothetical protein
MNSLRILLIGRTDVSPVYIAGLKWLLIFYDFMRSLLMGALGLGFMHLRFSFWCLCYGKCE